MSSVIRIGVRREGERERGWKEDKLGGTVAARRVVESARFRGCSACYPYVVSALHFSYAQRHLLSARRSFLRLRFDACDLETAVSFASSPSLLL